jgi:predicted AAA+ superfamily ATPase
MVYSRRSPSSAWYAAASCMKAFPSSLCWLGYLLYGEPGTGKSSTIHAMVMFCSRMIS